MLEQSIHGAPGDGRVIYLEFMSGPSDRTTVRRCINCLRPFEPNEPWLLVTDTVGGFSLGFHSACYYQCADAATVGTRPPAPE